MRMPLLIVCRALRRGLEPDERLAIKTLSAVCAEELHDARHSRWQVIHYFTRWPSDAALLKGCSARADEPVFTGPIGSIYRSEPLCRHLEASNVREATLIGLIDARILAVTLHQAPGEPFAFRSEPALTGIIEPARTSSLLI